MAKIRERFFKPDHSRGLKENQASLNGGCLSWDFVFQTYDPSHPAKGTAWNTGLSFTVHECRHSSSFTTEMGLLSHTLGNLVGPAGPRIFLAKCSQFSKLQDS